MSVNIAALRATKQWPISRINRPVAAPQSGASSVGKRYARIFGQCYGEW